MGAVQRLATVVIVGLVALATVLVLYLADENNRIDATALQQRDEGIARATTNFISLCMSCHGPAGMGYTGPDAKDANGNPTGRIGAALGGVNEVLNHTGKNDKGTPWPGATELGVTYSGGFAGRTAWITNRITNGLLNPDGKTYRMPPFSEAKGGPLNDAQIEELVWLIQYGDWNKVYNQAIATSGGYPTPPPAKAATTPTPAAAAPAQASTGGEPTYEIDAIDIAYSVKELTIPADTEVTIKVVNKGASVHTFDIDALNIHSGDIQPGDTFTTKVKAAAGKYEYYCNIPGHKEAGMDGTLIADPNAKAPASAGGEAAPPAAASAAAAGGVPATTVNLDMEDIKFVPDSLTIPGNTDVTIHITNKGATAHDFSIDELGISTGDVQPGATIDVKVNAKPGAYTYYCNVPGHEAAGMKGTLTVTETPAQQPAQTTNPTSAAANPGAQSGTTPPAASGGAQTIQLDMEDIKFSKDSLEIPANTDVTIHITNTGATDHDFSIDALNISTGNVAPGASVDVKINAPAGTYTYYCNVPGHEAAGMKGTLTVK